MFVLDTDHLTVLERGGAGSLTLELRLAELASSDVATTIVTYEEQMRGWMARLGEAQTMARVVSAYAHLLEHIETFRRIPIIPFDDAAAAEYARLAATRIRMGTMDLRIASIAIVHRATLLTRNLADFARVPGLQAEDWTS